MTLSGDRATLDNPQRAGRPQRSHQGATSTTVNNAHTSLRNVLGPAEVPSLQVTAARRGAVDVVCEHKAARRPQRAAVDVRRDGRVVSHRAVQQQLLVAARDTAEPQRRATARCVARRAAGGAASRRAAGCAAGRCGPQLRNLIRAAHRTATAVRAATVCA
eukprot:4222745-Prymnesium_polylepis.1